MFHAHVEPERLLERKIALPAEDGPVPVVCERVCKAVRAGLLCAAIVDRERVANLGAAPSVVKPFEVGSLGAGARRGKSQLA